MSEDGPAARVERRRPAPHHGPSGRQTYALPRHGLTAGAVGVGSEGRTYRLVAPIQRGGMGELFLAEMQRAGEPPQRVVIKRLLSDLQDDERYIKMFRSEAAVMARLQHPNIVRLLDTPIVEQAQCLAMEFVYGRNVQQILRRHDLTDRAIPVQIALAIIVQGLRGLHHAHTFIEPDGRPLHLVHRDVTPGNLLVGYNGTAKLTDFGIAKSKMSLVSTTVGIVKGKARYLAPEQILGEPATPRSDVYSAAVVTVELLTGTPLFERGALPKTLHDIVHGERPSLSLVLPHIHPTLRTALDRALSVESRQRPATADAFAQLLLHAARHYGGLASSPDLGQYLQGVFHDRTPLPPLGSQIREAGPDENLPLVPLGALENTPSNAPPTTEEPWAPVALEAPEEDPAPTHIVTHDPLSIDASPSPSFDEAMSALALLRRAKSVAPHPVPKTELAATRSARRSGRATSFLLGGFLGACVGAIASVLILDGLDLSSRWSGLWPGPFASTPRGAPATDSASPPAAAVPKTIAPTSSPAAPIPEEDPGPVVPTAAPATLDVLSPRGAQIILDGQPLNVRVPARHIEVAPGAHALRVIKGRYRKRWSFDAAPGDLLEVGRQLRHYSVEPQASGRKGIRRR